MLVAHHQPAPVPTTAQVQQAAAAADVAVSSQPEPREVPKMAHNYSSIRVASHEPASSPSGYFDLPRGPRGTARAPNSPHPLSMEYKSDEENDTTQQEQQQQQPLLAPRPPLPVSASAATSPDTHIEAPTPVRPGMIPKDLHRSEQAKPAPTSKPGMDRPALIRFYSTPTLPALSPTRHQFRLPNSAPRLIKETLNASLHIDETGKKINQYQIKEEIGRGSFGTVWLVVDTITNEQFVSLLHCVVEKKKHTLTSPRP